MLTRLTIFIIFMGLSVAGQSLESSPSTRVGSDHMEINYKSKSDNFWKQHLKPDVYTICRLKGTELAGSGKYSHFYEKGTYYCACCGGDHALYSSEAKFDSGTGWPSFWEPISSSSVVESKDHDSSLGFFDVRTEVTCSRCGGHLGHVFKDGPKEHTGLRYCMNSSALVFVPEGQEPKSTFEKALLEKEPKS